MKKNTKENGSSIIFYWAIAKPVINTYKEQDIKITKLTTLIFQYCKTL